MKKERVLFVSLVRIIAIVLIVLFHVMYEIFQDHGLRPIGFIGVSLFFIVSGFVLAKIYPNLTEFSGKWFLKKYFKIALVYYLALVFIVILFGKQVYSGNVFANLGLHFAFLDGFFSQVAYGIISPAWFIVPLICFYFLFPYLNRFIKKSYIFLILAFVISIAIRFYLGTWTSYNPLFFLAEFCFGIAFVYKPKNILILISAVVLIVNPLMFIPFAVFYSLSFINSTMLTKLSNILGFFEINMIIIFLSHEAFINVLFNKWNIFGLSIWLEIIILALGMVGILIVSREIQNRLLEFNKDINQSKLC
ncbi:MAG: acyltransferase family protein [Candidatus Pacearchaeota archaeon]|jgi:peptidoglycan/LPS O-acetylase OafA/YrhL